jgi:26S proteasome regulatory subunit T4
LLKVLELLSIRRPSPSSAFFRGKVDFNDIGGLGDQIRVLRETIELPITNLELFKRMGIKPAKGCLLYGPPGTGKTLIARALACNVEATFLKVVASAIVDKYIG